ncbi:MAG: hypothetical protein WCY54_08415 [Syntrophales bacterium]|nr:hypothetical protein [Syntrophales bacterium]
MAQQIDPAVLSLVKADLTNAAYGAKTLVMQSWATRLGCSLQSLYREFPTGRSRKAERKLAGIEDAALVIARIKSRPPEHRGQITTTDALRIALDNHLIPETLADVPAGTFDRVLREIGASQHRRRVERFQAERPNELHHIDASSSDCLYIARELPDGDYVLRIHGGTKDYKNKPVPIRLRPWVYGLTDDYSGYHCARYIAALGENAGDNIDFLCWAWSQTPEKELFGLPEKIKGDHGPMMSSEGIPDWFERLGVQIDDSTVLNKEAHGKIERPWRTMWQRFELPFFAESEWRKFEIPLSELNARFMRYQREYNDRQHRFEKTISRRQAWLKIGQYGGAVALPENAIRTIARRYPRKLDQAGCFSIDNVIYEVKGLHDAWVWVYLGVFEDAMVAVDQRTGEKYAVVDFRPNRLGEYTATRETPYQQARKDAVNLTGIRNTLYTEDAPSPANVTKFPTRIKEVKTIENPLSLNTYPDVETALGEFQTLCGFMLDRDSRDQVRALIVENGLSKRFVVDLAMEIQAEQARAAL